MGEGVLSAASVMKVKMSPRVINTDPLTLEYLRFISNPALLDVVFSVL